MHIEPLTEEEKREIERIRKEMEKNFVEDVIIVNHAHKKFQFGLYSMLILQ